VITYRDVGVRYASRDRAALQGVSFEATRGRITAVVGPNGSGKSTLVRALLGSVHLETGRIEIDGTHIASLARREIASRVAAVTQREDVVFPLKVREYVQLGRYPRLGLWRSVSAADVAAVRRALDLTGADAFLDRALSQLSGGEWQRVRLARALAQGGDAIVLDEPTTFLDVGHEMHLFELLGRLASEGHAVLLVSHQLNLVARFAAHMVLLHHGRIEAAGTPDDVMQAGVLERVYEWPLVITRDPAVGAPTLILHAYRHS